MLNRTMLVCTPLSCTYTLVGGRSNLVFNTKAALQGSRRFSKLDFAATLIPLKHNMIHDSDTWIYAGSDEPKTVETVHI
jgi:hypothetical protein